MHHLNRRDFLATATAAGCTALPLLASAAGTGRGPAQPPLHAADFSVFEPNDTLDLFLLAGQSNMKGRGAIDMKPKEDRRILFLHAKKLQWYIARDPLHATGTPDRIDGSDNAGTGPGMSFARTLARNDEALNIGLIPAAVGGAPIDAYGKDGKLYTRSLMMTRRAMQRSPLKTRLRALLWLQGESDATPQHHAGYETKLLDLVDRYRNDLAIPELPFLACTIGSFITSKRFNQWEAINKVLLRLPEQRQHTACIDARDLQGHIGDRLHYDTPSQIKIGKRFAAAFMRLNP